MLGPAEPVRRRSSRTARPRAAAGYTRALGVAALVRRRRWSRSPGWPAGRLPAAVSLLALPLAALLARDRYRNLGHAVIDDRLITRVGSLVRRRSTLAVPGVIGVTLRQSVFQRRSGLISLTATTAAGAQHYEVPDLARSRRHRPCGACCRSRRPADCGDHRRTRPARSPPCCGTGPASADCLHSRQGSTAKPDPRSCRHRRGPRSRRRCGRPEVTTMRLSEVRRHTGATSTSGRCTAHRSRSGRADRHDAGRPPAAGDGTGRTGSQCGPRRPRRRREDHAGRGDPGRHRCHQPARDASRTAPPSAISRTSNAGSAARCRSRVASTVVAGQHVAGDGRRTGPAQSGRHPRARRFRRRTAGRSAGRGRRPVRHLRVRHRRRRRRRSTAPPGCSGRNAPTSACRARWSITHIDQPRGDFAAAVENCQLVFGDGVHPLYLPVEHGGSAAPTALIGLLSQNVFDTGSRPRIARPADEDEQRPSRAPGRADRSRDHRIRGRRPAGPLPGAASRSASTPSSTTWRPRSRAAPFIRCVPCVPDHRAGRSRAARGDLPGLPAAGGARAAARLHPGRRDPRTVVRQRERAAGRRGGQDHHRPLRRPDLDRPGVLRHAAARCAGARERPFRPVLRTPGRTRPGTPSTISTNAPARSPARWAPP